ncbi:MAG: hypothetical protein ACOC0O_03130 [Spirochaetota bacterium]
MSFRRSDFRTIVPRARTVHVCYLSPRVMHHVRELLERVTVSDAVLVSVLFGVRGWRPARSVTVGDVYRPEVLVYER